MRLLSIFGNTIRKRFIAGVSSCCVLLWEDGIEWRDQCNYPAVECITNTSWEAAEAENKTWEDSCLWLEIACCDEIWENTELWNNSCPW